MGLLPSLGAFIAGILLADRFSALPDCWLWLPLLIGILTLALHRQRMASLLQLLFFCTLGLSLFLLQIRSPQHGNHISRILPETPVIIEGEILDVTRRAAGGAVLTLELASLEHQQTQTTASGTISLLILNGYPDCRPGDLVRCRTRLRPALLYGTPGERDWPRYFALRGIFARGTLASADDLLLMRAEKGWSSALDRKRQLAGQFIDRVIPATEAPLVRALVTGDKGGMDPATRDLLARGGVSHLFAISGLHLGLLAAALLAPAFFLWRRSETLLLWQPPRRAIPLLLLPVLLLFFLWTGGAISTLRALLMYAGGVALLLSSRRTHPLYLLAAAALLALLVTPASLFEPAFQLSFAAVAGMLLLLPSLIDQFSGQPVWLRYLTGAIFSTVAATVATLPLVAAHFHLLAPAGLLVNPIAIPLIGFLAVPAGLLGVLLLPVAPESATVLFQWCGWINALLLDLVRWSLTLPGMAGSWYYAPPLRYLALALLGLALLLPLQRQWLRWRLLLLAGAIPLWLIPWPLQTHPSITVFSVGQGESILVTTADQRQILIDGGGSSYSDFDPGRQLVAPALGRLGATHLDAVLMTHGHPDHALGLHHILEAIPTDQFLVSAEQELDPALAEILDRRRIPIQRLESGWTQLEELSLRVYASKPATNENNRSLVTYVVFGGQGALLTGDLEADGVADLLKQPPPGPVSLLKLPHHGSRHSAPDLLLDKFSPRVAVASVGRENRFGFPHQETQEALAQRGIPLLRTDRDGTVQFVPAPAGWTVTRWSNGNFH